MDLSKLGDENPYKDFLNTPIHIIGCGSIGSTVAELISRYGFKNFKLYDFDFVEGKNICNQMFFDDDIGTNKTVAVEKLLLRVNPDLNGHIKRFEEGYCGQPLSGFVFLCVDNIELRREIAEKNKYNPNIRAMFDYRTLLKDAQHYGCDWKDKSSVANFIETMQFSHEEAQEETPVSACGVVLGEAAVIRSIVTQGVTNFLNFLRNGKMSPLIMSSPYNHSVLAM
jgi:hypothetical protein